MTLGPIPEAESLCFSTVRIAYLLEAVRIMYDIICGRGWYVVLIVTEKEKYATIRMYYAPVKFSEGAFFYSDNA